MTLAEIIEKLDAKARALWSLEARQQRRGLVILADHTREIAKLVDAILRLARQIQQ
jgi:hypothetical protein